MLLFDVAVLLLASNFNEGILLDCSTEWLGIDLVLGSDNLMEGEQKLSHEIVILEIIDVFKIIYVIYHHFELLLLFELVRHVETLDPLRIEAVHDHFGLSKLLPHGASFLIKDYHSVSTSESIQIWQVFAPKRES